MQRGKMPHLWKGCGLSFEIVWPFPGGPRFVAAMDQRRLGAVSFAFHIWPGRSRALPFWLRYFATRFRRCGWNEGGKMMVSEFAGGPPALPELRI